MPNGFGTGLSAGEVLISEITGASLLYHGGVAPG